MEPELAIALRESEWRHILNLCDMGMESLSPVKYESLWKECNSLVNMIHKCADDSMPGKPDATA